MENISSLQANAFETRQVRAKDVQVGQFFRVCGPSCMAHPVVSAPRYCESPILNDDRETVQFQAGPYGVVQFAEDWIEVEVPVR